MGFKELLHRLWYWLRFEWYGWKLHRVVQKGIHKAPGFEVMSVQPTPEPYEFEGWKQLLDYNEYRKDKAILFSYFPHGYVYKLPANGHNITAELFNAEDWIYYQSLTEKSQVTLDVLTDFRVSQPMANNPIIWNSEPGKRYKVEITELD